MSKLFFDHLLVLDDIEVVIKKNATSVEEREEWYALVDETITAKVLEKVLGKLPEEYHPDLLNKFAEYPYAEKRILGFVAEKTGQDIKKVEDWLRDELKEVGRDILKEIMPQDEVSRETKVSKK